MLIYCGKTVQGKRAKARVVPYILPFEKRAWSELSLVGFVLAKADWRGPNQSHGVKLQLNRVDDQSLPPLPLCI